MVRTAIYSKAKAIALASGTGADVSKYDTCTVIVNVSTLGTSPAVTFLEGNSTGQTTNAKMILPDGTIGNVFNPTATGVYVIPYIGDGAYLKQTTTGTSTVTAVVALLEKPALSN
jgi:hypothetical protein